MKKLTNNKLWYIRYKRYPKYWKVLITNIVWDRKFLSEKDFDDLIHWREKLEISRDLNKRWFLNTKQSRNYLINCYKVQQSHLIWWPWLHIISLTRWCNLWCLYCHSITVWKWVEKYHLKKEVADKYLDIIFTSPLNNYSIEYQWWEPTINRDIFKYLTEQIKIKSKETWKKINIQTTINLYEISDEQIEFIFENDISFNTSIDWHLYVQNKNRPAIDKWSTFDKVTNNVKKIRKKEKEYDKKLLTAWIAVVSKYTLPYHKELLQTYVDLWFNWILIKYLDWVWKSQKTKNFIWYWEKDYINFYKNILKWIKKINKTYSMNDLRLSLFARKILSKWNLWFVDLQNPCWAWIWQVWYDRDWNIYTCDEWRVLDNWIFKIWDYQEINNVSDIVQSQTTSILANISTLESNICDNCEFNPYCWVCPAHNFSNEGKLLLDIRKTFRHKFNYFMINYIFEEIILKEDKSRFKVIEKMTGINIEDYQQYYK